MQATLLLISTVFVQMNISIAPLTWGNPPTNLVIPSHYFLEPLASTAPKPPKPPCDKCEEKDAKYCCVN